ncbi:uncharacterized protein BDR25DRAFT_394587 [Lindgomyces ingoldianus]|uniref:Uncharacterized protein n=1 Tax=Lindgomyces ingoldianus TaxID=673940 RepID=A0ACB6QPA9_9PLEO|nr:uncharacterized protein BDR25DRAFT_394587 [Lindgomyces ingoldianus]KAF2468746.1 hypothetical protein BDR25DRAFT_394587 [Lindgomyces ingoldianus]
MPYLNTGLDVRDIHSRCRHVHFHIRLQFLAASTLEIFQAHIHSCFPLPLPSRPQSISLIDHFAAALGLSSQIQGNPDGFATFLVDTPKANYIQFLMVDPVMELSRLHSLLVLTRCLIHYTIFIRDWDFGTLSLYPFARLPINSILNAMRIPPSFTNGSEGSYPNGLETLAYCPLWGFLEPSAPTFDVSHLSRHLCQNPLATTLGPPPPSDLLSFMRKLRTACTLSLLELKVDHNTFYIPCAVPGPSTSPSHPTHPSSHAEVLPSPARFYGGSVCDLPALQILKQLMNTIDPKFLTNKKPRFTDAYVLLLNSIFQKQRHCVTIKSRVQERFDSYELDAVIKEIAATQGLAADTMLKDDRDASAKCCDNINELNVGLCVQQRATRLAIRCGSPAIARYSAVNHCSIPLGYGKLATRPRKSRASLI